MNDRGASPGGPVMSLAKKRRLEALEETMGKAATRTASAPQPVRGQLRATGINPEGNSRGGANSTTATIAAAPAQAGSALGQFPYTPLCSTVLEGILNVGAGGAPAAGLRAQQQQHAGGTPAGGNAAAQLFAQLLATNPRISSGDVASVVSQRLGERSTVLLDNPTAPVKAGQLFAKKGTTYASNLRPGQLPTCRGDNPPMSYELCLQIHELWCQYMRALLGSSRAGSHSSAAPSAAGFGTRPDRALGQQVDLHGCLLAVVQHRDPRHVGVRGIVLRQAKRSLHIVQPDNTLQVVPLQGCIYEYSVHGHTVRVVGSGKVAQ